MPQPTPEPAHDPSGGLVLHAPPPGLLDAERQWIEAYALSAGGLTPAFCQLVRLRIVSDALEAFNLDLEGVEAQARREGLSRAATRRRVHEWAQTRAAALLEPRWKNLLAWRRPGEPGGYGADAVDDPAHPLPPAQVRCLIAEGRRVCDEEA